MKYYSTILVRKGYPAYAGFKNLNDIYFIIEEIAA